MTNRKRQPATFYIIRHGETIWNVERRMQGHQDSPLTENGIEQALTTKKMLERVSFDHVLVLTCSEHTEQHKLSLQKKI